MIESGNFDNMGLLGKDLDLIILWLSHFPRIVCSSLLKYCNVIRAKARLGIRISIFLGLRSNPVKQNLNSIFFSSLVVLKQDH